MKVAIAGTSYVGPSNALLLAQHNDVVALDIIAEKWKCSIVSNHQLRMLILRII